MKTIYHNFKKSENLKENDLILVEVGNKWRKAKFIQYHRIDFNKLEYIIISAKINNKQNYYSNWKILTGVNNATKDRQRASLQ